MGDDRTLRLLELDLEYLHRAIDKFDNQRFAIKSWVVTTSGALLALGVSGRNPGIPVVGMFVVIFFAYLELVYMDMQVRAMKRSASVGQLLKSATFDSSKFSSDDYDFGIRAALGNDPFRWSRVPSILATRPELYMFYLGLLAAMALTTVLLWLVR